jgi:hypothetical protein
VDDSIIEYNSVHTDQYIVVDGASVNDGAMGNRYVVANVGGRFFECSMDDGIILYVDIVANPDIVDITANNCSKPNTTVVAKSRITNDYGTLCQKTVFTHNWGFTPQSFYDGHFLKKVIFVHQK